MSATVDSDVKMTAAAASTVAPVAPVPPTAAPTAAPTEAEDIAASGLLLSANGTLKRPLTSYFRFRQENKEKYKNVAEATALWNAATEAEKAAYKDRSKAQTALFNILIAKYPHLKPEKSVRNKKSKTQKVSMDTSSDLIMYGPTTGVRRKFKKRKYDDDLEFQPNKVARIAELNPDVHIENSNGYDILSKATEMFVHYLVDTSSYYTAKAVDKAKKRKAVTKEHFQKGLDNFENLQFLRYTLAEGGHSIHPKLCVQAPPKPKVKKPKKAKATSSASASEPPLKKFKKDSKTASSSASPTKTKQTTLAFPTASTLTAAPTATTTTTTAMDTSS